MKKIYFAVFCFMLLQSVSVNADITLAVIAPKTGEASKSGHELFEGAKLAVQEINDEGGINGEKLDMLTIDDRCDDRLAVSTAEMLSLLNSKKIGLVIGPYCSNRFNEISAIYKQSKIFQIVPTTEAYYSGSADKKGQILLLNTKAEMSKDFFQFYNQHFAGLKVGFVYDGREEYGYADVAKSLYEEFRRYGKSYFLKFYMTHTSDMQDMAKTVINDGMEIVFVLADSGDISYFIHEVKELNNNMIVFTSKKMVTEEMLKRLGTLADGLYLLDMAGLKSSLLFTESLVNLRLLGIEPEGLETYSYVSVKLWSDLAKQVKSFDYYKLIQALNSPLMQEKWGDFLMHSGRVGAAKYSIEMYQNGTFKQLY